MPHHSTPQLQPLSFKHRPPGLRKYFLRLEPQDQRRIKLCRNHQVKKPRPQCFGPESISRFCDHSQLLRKGLSQLAVARSSGRGERRWTERPCSVRTDGPERGPRPHGSPGRPRRGPTAPRPRRLRSGAGGRVGGGGRGSDNSWRQPRSPTRAGRPRRTVAAARPEPPGAHRSPHGR